MSCDAEAEGQCIVVTESKANIDRILKEGDRR